MRFHFKYGKWIIGLVCMVAVPLLTQAQQNRLINTNDWHYTYIQRLQQRGHLLSLNPTKLPYNIGDLRKALEATDKGQLGRLEAGWYEKLKEAVGRRSPNLDSMRVGGTFTAGARRSSSERLNVLNPKGEGRPLLPRKRTNAYMEYKNWIGQAGITFDWFYDIDPDGIDVARRLYIRSEEAYFGYNGDRMEAYVGRFDNHWSVHNRRGAFLTDNPRSFDQFQLTFGSDKLSFSSILGELDNAGADDTFSGYDHELGSVRRYLFLHRLDWSPTPNLKLTFMEGELYLSPTAGLSLRNILPLHFMFFESHNAPMNYNSNLLIGGGIWYQLGDFAFFFQGMLDDLVYKDRDTLREQNNLIPTVYTINTSLNWAEPVPRVDVGLEADLVSVNSYRTREHAQQWTYAQRGLATEFSDYVRLNAHAKWYVPWMEELTLRPGFTAYFKGIGDFHDLRTSTTPSGEQIPGILAGTVTRTLRPSLNLRYQPDGMQLFDPEHKTRFNWWLDADMGINYTTNADHREGRQETRFIGLFRLFGQVTF